MKHSNRKGICFRLSGILLLTFLLGTSYACSKKVGCPTIDTARLDKNGMPKKKSKSRVFSPKMEKQLHRRS